MNKFYLMLGAALLAGFFILSSLFYTGSIMGLATAIDVKKLETGDIIKGSFQFDSAKFGTVPLDSEVVMKVNTFVKKKKLSEVVPPEYLDKVAEGKFRPKVEIVISIRNKDNEGTVADSTLNGGSSDAAPPPTVTTNTGGETDPPLSAPPGPAPPSSPPTPATAEAIRGFNENSEKIITVSTRFGEDEFIPISDNQDATIIEVRVRGVLLGGSYAYLTRDGKGYLVGTSYVENVKGFSSGALQNINLELEKFGFVAPKSYANLEISVSYKDEYFISNSKSFSVADSTKPEPESLPEDAVNNNLFDEKSVIAPIIVPFPLTCEGRICTDYGPCAIPNLGIIVTDSPVLVTGLVQSRVCYCEESLGRVFTETRACALPLARVSVKSTNIKSKDTKITDLPRPKPFPRIVSGNNVIRRTVGLSNWRQSFSYLDFDLRVRGSIMRELEKDSAIKIRVGGMDHLVGVREINKLEKYAVIEVASDVQREKVFAGESAHFDLNNNGLLDIGVNVVSINSDKAMIQVESLDSQSIDDVGGGNGVALLKKNTEEPVAYIVVDKLPPVLKVLLVQSSFRYPSYCYNSIKDEGEGETDVDCGGQCKACQAEKKDYGLSIAWGVFALLWIASLFVLKRKNG